MTVKLTMANIVRFIVGWSAILLFAVIGALVLIMIVDLSTTGLRFAGDYNTYYWSDVWEWLKSFFAGS